MHLAFSTAHPPRHCSHSQRETMVILYLDGVTETRHMAGVFLGVDRLMGIGNAQNCSKAYWRGASPG